MKIIPLLLSSCLLSTTMIGCSQLPVTSNSVTPSPTVATHEAIIAYFAPDAGEEECACDSSILDRGYSLHPVENGYFRKLLGRDKDGRFLVQDFYQNSHKKQSDPFWIKEPLGLNSFDGKYIDGDVTGYYENGTINFKASYKDLQPIGKSENYYSNGQLGLQEEYIDDQTIIQKIWYKNGKIAAELRINPNDDNTIVESRVWNQQGQVVDDEVQSQNLLEELYLQFTTDQ
ncbi:membrane-binding protein [Acinetobacter sp.]|uniref:toxin-antitoxin system YwqK family antitoxin n=1 Tax=Acinetobacter sp. TaxID=472 RepID=UPI002586E088|nr:membrane-binding protein [Acinetobacter sp.]